MTGISPADESPGIRDAFSTATKPRPFWVLLAFLALAFAIYAPALNGEFVWDDHFLLGENPFFRSPVFATEVFRHHLYAESFSIYYRPVQNLSYMADYWLWGDRPTGYHCTNVALHASAAWLLWLLLRRLVPRLWNDAGRAQWCALLVSLVWLVHPIHNAAVAYIAGRADTLAALFALGAWLVWEKSRAHSRRGLRVLGASSAALLLLLALCSKEIALMWAVLFLLYTLFFATGISRREKCAVVAGLLAVVGLYAVLHSLPEHRAAAPGASAAPFADRVLLMFRALGDYCGLLFAPVRLTMERTLDAPGVITSRQAWWSRVSGEWLSILGLLTLAASVWLCAIRGPARSLRRFGALWFAIAFLPISNLIPLNAEVAEHWIYLASIGFLLLVAGSLAMLPHRMEKWIAFTVLAAVAALGVRTGFRAADWTDGERFARATIASGGTSPRILIYLANELGRKGRSAEQERILRRLLEVQPGFATARINLGLCLQKQGRLDEARALLESGAARTEPADVPRTWNAALNLAGQHHQAGRSDVALALIREWRPRFPLTWELAAYEATILADTGRISEAVAIADAYAGARWWHLPSQLGAASLHRAAGDFSGALAIARRATWLDIRGAAAFDEVARNAFALGRLDEALAAQAEAVARAPRNADHLEFFAVILRSLGREQDARAARRGAARLLAQAGGAAL